MKQVALTTFVIVALTSTHSKAWGKAAPPMPVPARLAVSECCFVGTVTKFEAKTTAALPYPSAPKKVDHLVAIVKIDKAFAGTNGLTHVRIGFVPNKANPRRRGPSWGYPKAGDTAMFFLKRHPSAAFFKLQPYSDVIYKDKNTQWTKQLAEAEKATKALQNISENLQSKDPATRYMTAAMMVIRYRTPPQSQFEQKSIDAKESQLILEALASADWKARQPYYFNASTVFYRLNLTKNDGWQPPKDYKQFEAEAKKWLKSNAKTYRIKKYVAKK